MANPSFQLASIMDLEYMRELLGYKKLKTTQVHSQVIWKDVSQIRSPLDKVLERKVC